MCGIIGAIAQRDNVADILLEGLNRLEYRGYDSAGMALLHPKTHKIQRIRVQGKVEALVNSIKKKPLFGKTGIAHTRWATHGQPSQKNAHPHCSQKTIAVVHNGIIENHNILRRKLIRTGYKFESETDTEVIAHLINYYWYWQSNNDLLAAIHQTAQALKGAYALGIISTYEPKILYAVRYGSPLVIGLGIGKNFIASDQLALLHVTQRFIYLEEGDLAKINLKNVSIYDANKKAVKRTIHTEKIDYSAINKGKYHHYMQKEIFEQPQAVLNTINDHFTEPQLTAQRFGQQAASIFKKIQRIQLVACGTSYHAALVGRYWLEALASIPCQVDVASENRYRNEIIEPNTLFVALSQSGETADTLAALRQAKKTGYIVTLCICNVPKSSLAREADLTFLTQAGTEIGVAATKTFTTQLVALLLLTFLLLQNNQKLIWKSTHILFQLKQLPFLLQKTLKLNCQIKQLSKQFSDKEHAFFLGRGAMFPIALEGALKLKEISYIHAEAYPAGELKHGPLALVDKGMPIIVVAPNDHLIEKLASNIQEIQARGGKLYVFIDHRINWQQENNTTLIKMPSVSDFAAPVVYTIPLQLLAYHIAIIKGTNVDQPRNLAKSVTVE